MSEERPRPYRPESAQPVDLSEWPFDVSEHVAESCEQGLINRTLLSSLEELIAARGWSRVFAAADNYFAWQPGAPAKRVSPDVYLVDDPPERIPKMWRTWLPGNPPPRWAVEVVSEDWLKDYVQDPAKYEELGCRELVVFYPEAALGQTRNRRRVALTVYRRDEKGRLVQVHSGPGPAWPEQLAVWLIVVREGYSVRLRLSEDREGRRIIPTSAESKAALLRALDLQKAARAVAEEDAREAQARLRELEQKAARRRVGRRRKPKPGSD